jgi:hypothetical protein
MSRGQNTASLQKNSSNSHKQITYKVKNAHAYLNKSMHRTLREEITMKKSFVRTLSIAALCILVIGACSSKSPVEAQDSELWPNIEPFKTGLLKVSDIHEIYYELCGNLEGKPVFVLHGGPGARISPYYRRFFNPDSYLIVLHDQRGTQLPLLWEI